MTRTNYIDSGLNKNEKLYLKDEFAIKILRDNRNRDYLLNIISKALDLSMEDIKRDFEILDTRLGLSKDNVDSEADLVIRNSDSYINIEINYSLSPGITDNKNMSYICALYLRQLEKGHAKESYKNLKRINQININNYDQFKEGRFIYTSVLKEIESNKVRGEWIKIIDINLDFLTEMDYTKIESYEKNSLERLLYVFVCNDKSKLDEMYIGDEIMEKVKDQLYNLENSVDRFLFYDKEALRKEESFDYGLKQGREEGRKEGRKEGIREGLNKEKYETVKRMLKMDIPKDIICEATKLPLEEIEKIKDSIN